MPYVYCMATATTTQEIEMTTTKTTTINKVGNAYATADLPWDRVVNTPAKWWSHNEKNYYYGDSNSCQCCGRKVGANPLGAIIVDGGGKMCRLADANAFEKYDGGWMGWYPVGSECAKKFPAGYLTTLTGD